VSSIEKTLRVGVVGLGLLSGCSSTTSPPVPPPPEGGRQSVPQVAAAEAPKTSAGTARLPLGPPGPVRNWAEVRLQAAHRLMAANPGRVYEGPVVEPLLGIPVLQIDLNGDGSVRSITVLRHPQEARDTSRLAEDAVRRAAPFGDVSRLPKPWRFTETFLFNDERKFKPRTLDQ
jgi:hypothetical protein